MGTIKESALQAIESLPEDATIDDIMYRLYVVEKVRAGQAAALSGKTVTVEELKEEMAEW